MDNTSERQSIEHLGRLPKVIALPSIGPGGLTAKLGIHFGRSRQFTIVKYGGEQPEVFVMDTGSDHGCVDLIPLLRRHGVEAVAIRHMGQRPLAECLRAGIEVFMVDAATVGEASEQLRAGMLRPLGIADACRGESPPHGHGRSRGAGLGVRGCAGHRHGAGIS